MCGIASAETNTESLHKQCGKHSLTYEFFAIEENENRFFLLRKNFFLIFCSPQCELPLWEKAKTIN